MLREFDARLQKGDNPGAWTCVVLDDAAELFGTRGLVKIRGTLAGEDRYEREFQIALALYGEEMAFERARTQLALGIRSVAAPLRDGSGRVIASTALDGFGLGRAIRA